MSKVLDLSAEIGGELNCSPPESFAEAFERKHGDDVKDLPRVQQFEIFYSYIGSAGNAFVVNQELRKIKNGK